MTSAENGKSIELDDVEVVEQICCKQAILLPLTLHCWDDALGIVKVLLGAICPCFPWLVLGMNLTDRGAQHFLGRGVSDRNVVVNDLQDAFVQVGLGSVYLCSEDGATPTGTAHLPRVATTRHPRVASGSGIRY